MLQEYIPAAPGHDWFFHGYAGVSGATCQPACTGVKDRSYPAHAGLTSFGRCVPNEALREAAAGLLARIGYRGIADLDLRLDDRDGQYKLLDFNPRLGAQFRLFTAAGGLDVVRAAYLDLTGQAGAAAAAADEGGAAGGGEPAAGRSFMVESYDPLSAISYWRSGELRLGNWLAATMTVDETAWFARDNLRPFELMCVRMGWRMIIRPLAQWRRRPWRESAGSRQDPDRPSGPRLRRGRGAGKPSLTLSAAFARARGTNSERRRRCGHRGSRTVRAVSSRAPARRRSQLPPVRSADAPVA